MKNSTQQLSVVQLQIVGGNKFGRYPKVSNEQTWNMIQTDDCLVPYAGYRLASLSGGSQGRGFFKSTRLNKMIEVVDNQVFAIDTNINRNRIGSIETSEGNVYIDENDVDQIAICDQKNIYIYNWSASTFAKVVGLDFIPGYIAFQDGYFIATSVGQPVWYLSAPGDGLTWPQDATSTGTFQTKPDNTQAAVRMPGKGNMLLVMGETVTECWTDIGANLFPYQRSSWFNIDYGCINPATIATSDTFIVWLGINEKSGIVLLYSDGGSVQPLSDEGLNYLFANLTNPSNCYGFLFKQDGHLIYQFTFPDDNRSFIFDFETKQFFSVSDENQNYHIAKKVVFFNNKYYFISFIDGSIYEFSSNIYNLNGLPMPKIRLIKNIRLPDSSPFVVNNLNFMIEQGNDLALQAVDLSISTDGGVNFSSQKRKTLNAQGRRKNRLNYWNLGRSNDFVAQIQFWGEERFVVGNGTVSYYQ